MTNEHKRLSARQQTFIAEYLIDPNATQAAIRAGYSPKSAQHNAVRLMANDGIAAAIAEGKRAQIEEAGLTAVGILKEVGHLASVDMRDFFDENGNFIPIKDWTPAMGATAGVQHDPLRQMRRPTPLPETYGRRDPAVCRVPGPDHQGVELKTAGNGGAISIMSFHTVRHAGMLTNVDIKKTFRLPGQGEPCPRSMQGRTSGAVGDD